MTVLELVVVLGIVAGATAMAAASIPKRVTGEGDAFTQLNDFVTETRLTAIQTGQPALLVIHQGGARSGDRQIAWSVADLRVLGGGLPIRDYRAFVSTDGVISGAPLSVEGGQAAFPIAGVYREAVP